MDVLELSFAYLLEEVGLLFGPEGIIPLQNHKQKHSETPEISINRDMILFGDDLRGHVGRRSAKGVDSARGNRLKTEPKIDKFELFVPVEQNVLSLDVSVDYVALMQIFECVCDSLEDLFGFSLLKSVLRFGQEVVIEGVGSPVLLDEVDFGCALDGVDEFGDNRVVEFG